MKRSRVVLLVLLGLSLVASAGDASTVAQRSPPGLLPSQALALGAYRTVTVDLTQTGTYAVSMPTVSGYRFVMSGTARLELHTCNATLTTGLTFSVLQNGTQLPGTSTGLTFATALFNTFPAPSSLNGNPVNMAIPDMSTYPLQFQITTGVAGSGLTSCTGKFVLLGYYTPYP